MAIRIDVPNRPGKSGGQSLGSIIGTVGGGVAGGLVGGPAGAMTGASLGGTAGGLVGGVAAPSQAAKSTPSLNPIERRMDTLSAQNDLPISENSQILEQSLKSLNERPELKQEYQDPLLQAYQKSLVQDAKTGRV